MFTNNIGNISRPKKTFEEFIREKQAEIVAKREPSVVKTASSKAQSSKTIKTAQKDKTKSESQAEVKTVKRERCPAKPDVNLPEDAKVVKKTEKSEKSSSSEVRFVKIANLNAENKKKLRDYWSTIYPKAYVDALISDK